MLYLTNYPVPDPNVYGINSATQPKAGTIFPSAARGAAAYNSPDLWNPWAKGVRLYVDITAATGTLIVKIQTKDPVSLNYVDLAGAVTASLSSGTTALIVYPGTTETANVDVSDPLGVNWRVVATVSANPVTFSVSGEYLI